MSSTVGELLRRPGPAHERMAVCRGSSPAPDGADLSGQEIGIRVTRGEPRPPRPRPSLVMVYELRDRRCQAGFLPLSIGDGDPRRECRHRRRGSSRSSTTGCDPEGRPRFPRRRTDRPVAQPEHDRDRRYVSQSGRAAARRGRRSGDRRVLPRGDRRDPPQAAEKFVERLDFVRRSGSRAGRAGRAGARPAAAAVPRR